MIYPGHKNVILWDNNLMASPYWFDILNEIREMYLVVDFNQGLDARLIDDETAKLIGSMHTKLVRTAYDVKDDGRVGRGIHLLIENGVRPRKILVYLLYNFDSDAPEDLLFRLQESMRWKVTTYPMRYQPINGQYALRKDSFISPKWTLNYLKW